MLLNKRGGDSTYECDVRTVRRQEGGTEAARRVEHEAWSGRALAPPV